MSLLACVCGSWPGSLLQLMTGQGTHTEEREPVTTLSLSVTCVSGKKKIPADMKSGCCVNEQHDDARTIAICVCVCVVFEREVIHIQIPLDSVKPSAPPSLKEHAVITSARTRPADARADGEHAANTYEHNRPVVYTGGGGGRRTHVGLKTGATFRSAPLDDNWS